jgi:Ca2+-binding RTX toxin-like protein
VARASTKPRARFGVLAGAAAAALLAFPGAASAAVTSSVSAAGALSVNSTADDAIAITCVDNQVKVNGDNPNTGAAACDAITSISVNGGPGNNLIDLSGVADEDPNPAVNTDFPKVGSVFIEGNGGNDTIRGSEHADEMLGGEGHDRISGDDNPAGTRDVFEGGSGDDTMAWNPGDDDDTMDGQTGTDTVEVNGGGGPEQFTVKPSPTAGRVQFDRTGPSPQPGPFNLDIGTSEKLDMNAGGGDDSFTADAGLDALGLELDVDGGPDNDTIDGGDGADTIGGGEGNDTINADDNPVDTLDLVRGDAGDDIMIWNGGDDNDVNDGGAGDDTARVNGAAFGEDFTIGAGTTAGRAFFERLNTTPVGGFTIDIGTTEVLDLNANAGDDKLNAAGGARGIEFLSLDVDGGDGNDTLNGGDGPDAFKGEAGDDRLAAFQNPTGTRDLMSGGDGDDTSVWNPGDDDDTMVGGAGNDTTEVNGGDVDEDFTVKPSATAGRVAFDRTGPSPPGPFNLDIGTTENLVVNANGGNDTIIGAKGLAELIDSTLRGDDGKDRIKGTDGKDKLSGGKGRDLLRARDKASDAVNCGGGFDLAFVDRRDRVRGCEIVIGGRLRVKHSAKSVRVARGVAALELRCVGTQRCKGTAVLLRGSKSLGRKGFALKRGKAKTVRIKLSRRARRLLAGGSAKGMRVKLRITSRDSRGNGWRTTDGIRLKG